MNVLISLASRCLIECCSPFSCGVDPFYLQIKLSEYIGQKYVVLFFYPLDFTFVCPTGDI